MITFQQILTNDIKITYPRPLLTPRESDPMALHINPATGIIAPCSETPCQYGKTYKAMDEANTAREITHTIRYSGMPESYDYSFDKPLEKAIEKGFCKANPGEEFATGQLNLLLHPTAIENLCHMLRHSASEHRKNRIAKTIVHIIKTLGKESGDDFRESYSKHITPHLWGGEMRYKIMEAALSEGATQDELLSSSAELWLYRNSPLHKRAKYLLFAGEQKIEGYKPQEKNCIETYQTSHIAEKFSIDPETLAGNVLAYDIESDTARGYGLRPTKSQITEIVLCDHKQTNIISGDEKFILESFKNIMNAKASGGFVTLAGWNNHLFDNIFLQTRAEYHGIGEWGGKLQWADNFTSFEPCGPGTNPQKMSWAAPGGTMEDVDVFQEKVKKDLANGEKQIVGLKEFSMQNGANPIQVNRNEMHLLSAEDRRDYSLSDGICTLFAYSLMKK